MKIKLKNNIDFKIDKNQNNKGFQPVGMFWNIPKVKHNEIWYNCSIRFEKNTLIISNLTLHQENGYTIKENLTGDFYFSEVSKFRKNLILFMYNTHPYNFKLYKFKQTLIARKKTILVFTIAILLSLAYYFANIWSNNSVLIWISNNLLAQTFIIFLTLSGFINIFTPFTIQKELTKDDMEEISKSKIIQQQKEESQNKKSRDISSL